MIFNNNIIVSVPSQKHVGLALDSNLDFNQHIDEKINSCKKVVGIMKRLSMTLSKNLLTIYKSFFRPLLDHGDTVYEKSFNDSFKKTWSNVVEYKFGYY